MIDKLAEYQLFVDDTARFSERRQTVNNTYVAVNSLVLTAIAFLITDAGFVSIGRAFVAMLVLTAGILICLQWVRLILKYKTLINFRISELRKMEDDPAMAGCHRMYHLEDLIFPRDAAGNVIQGRGLNFSDRERWLPYIFITLYGLLVLAFALALIFAPQIIGMPH